MVCMAIASASLMAGCGDDNNPDNPENGKIDNPVVSNPEEPDGSLQEPEKAKAKSMKWEKNWSAWLMPMILKTWPL